jgi:Immunity protein 8
MSNRAISKITGFYYLNYPNDAPKDVSNAGSETYVEAGDKSSSENDFIATFSVFVCTPKFLASKMAEQFQPLFFRSLIVVSRFEDTVILEAVKKYLPEIQLFSERK